MHNANQRNIIFAQHFRANLYLASTKNIPFGRRRNLECLEGLELIESNAP